MASFNYTFIIPHKNIPQLLARCLAAIPRRPDVQIIVVDDASDPAQVDFAHFPGLDDPQVEVVFAERGGGPGYARNLGLERALGKWVVFADADDCYLDNLSTMMDRYVDSDFDMVVFQGNRVFPQEGVRDSHFTPIFYAAVATRNYEEIKRAYPHVWARFIRRTLIGTLRFPEEFYAEDVMFCIRLSLAAQKMKVVATVIYSQFVRSSSNVRNADWQNFYTRTKVRLGMYRYFERSGDTKWREYGLDKTWERWWYLTWTTNRWAALRLLPLVFRVTGRIPLRELFADTPGVRYAYKFLGEVRNPRAND